MFRENKETIKFTISVRILLQVTRVQTWKVLHNYHHELYRSQLPGMRTDRSGGAIVGYDGSRRVVVDDAW